MYICIDFDGTIVDHDFPNIGNPVPNAIGWMKEFIRYDAKLILFTMRSEGGKDGDCLTPAVDYLKENGIELFGINVNPTQSSWTTSPKAYGNFYIDDLAVGCPLIQPLGFKRKCVNWNQIGPIVVQQLLISQLTSHV